MKVTEGVFLSSNGINEIRCREYVPDGEPKGIVQLSHGLSEYFLRYDAFAKALAEAGYIVVGNDHLGHGESVSGEEDLGWLGDEPGWDRLIEDMRTLHNLTRSRHPGLPYFLFGHSMGSFLVRCYVIRYRDGIDGVILSGTGHPSRAPLEAAIALSTLELKRRGSRSRSAALCGLFYGQRTRPRDAIHGMAQYVSRDPDEVEEYLADPLCGFIPTAGLFRDMLGGMETMTKPRNLERMRRDLPVYFISGDSDPVGERGKGVIRAYKAFLAAGMRDVTMKLYAGARHELLRELNRGEVTSDIIAWLDTKCGRGADQ